MTADLNSKPNPPRNMGRGTEVSLLPTIKVELENDYKCPSCGKLLFKGRLAPGSSLEVLCTRRPRKRCNRYIKFQSM